MARAAYLRIVDASGNKIPARAYSGHYDGASYGRRLNTWGKSSAGINTTLWSNLNTLRARSRQLVRNDPLAAGGMDTLAANLLGQGITPRWRHQDLWNDWVDEQRRTASAISRGSKPFWPGALSSRVTWR